MEILIVWIVVATVGAILASKITQPQAVPVIDENAVRVSGGRSGRAERSRAASEQPVSRQQFG